MRTCKDVLVFSLILLANRRISNASVPQVLASAILAQRNAAELFLCAGHGLLERRPTQGADQKHFVSAALPKSGAKTSELPEIHPLQLTWMDDR